MLILEGHSLLPFSELGLGMQVAQDKLRTRKARKSREQRLFTRGHISQNWWSWGSSNRDPFLRQPSPLLSPLPGSSTTPTSLDPKEQPHCVYSKRRPGAS